MLIHCNAMFVIWTKGVTGCGKSTKLGTYAPFIVGGDVVSEASDWPWTVAIHYAGEFTGAGAYIGDGWVLSAAHLIQVIRGNGAEFIEQYVLFCTGFHLFCNIKNINYIPLYTCVSSNIY